MDSLIRDGTWREKKISFPSAKSLQGDRDPNSRLTSLHGSVLNLIIDSVSVRMLTPTSDTAHKPQDLYGPPVTHRKNHEVVARLDLETSDALLFCKRS
jgi:hypothetical protein